MFKFFKNCFVSYFYITTFVWWDQKVDQDRGLTLQRKEEDKLLMKAEAWV